MACVFIKARKIRHCAKCIMQYKKYFKIEFFLPTKCFFQISYCALLTYSLPFSVLLPYKKCTFIGFLSTFYLSLAITIHSCQSLVLQCSISRLNPDESSCQKRNKFLHGLAQRCNGIGSKNTTILLLL